VFHQRKHAAMWYNSVHENTNLCALWRLMSEQPFVN
jgi:hypothetical protein